MSLLQGEYGGSIPSVPTKCPVISVVECLFDLQITGVRFPHRIPERKIMESKTIKFDIDSTYHKLYESNGEKEVLLTAHEADELLDYLDYMAHISCNLNAPKKIGLLERLFGIKD
jgi:hypothetical protein